MITHFQKLNLMSNEDWHQILNIKEDIICYDAGMLTIQKDNSVTQEISEEQIERQTNLTMNLPSSNSNPCIQSNVRNEKKGMPIIRNLNYELEQFFTYYPTIIATLLKSIQTTLLDLGFLGAKPLSVRTYRNNHTVYWHRHKWPKGIAYNKGLITLYYMHPNWDVNNGGALNIGLIKEENTVTYDCLSNSLVGHLGTYGHGTDWLKLGYSGDRDVFVTNWVLT